MVHSPATKAADDPDGGGGDGGGARDNSGSATGLAPPKAAALAAPPNAEQDDTGFVEQKSKRARRSAAKARAKETGGATQGGAGSASNSTASGPSQDGANGKASGRPVPQRGQGEGAATRPKKLAAVDIMVLQLREHVVMGASNAAILAVLVQVQQLHRPLGWEKNQKTVAAITRTYEYDNPTDCNSIVRSVKHFFTMKNPLNVEEFRANMNTFQIVHVPESALPQKKNPWGAVDTPTSDAGDDEPMPSQSGQTQRKRWAATPRPPTRTELEQLARVA